MSRKIFSRQFVAGILAGGVAALAIWLGPRAWDHVFEQPPRVVPQPRAAALPEPPRQTEPPAPAVVQPPVVIEPLPPAPVRKHRVDEAAEAAATLARYAQSCRFWSARSGDAAGKIFRRRACDQMRDYARSTGQRVPSIKVDKRPKTTAAKPKSKSRRVVPNECTKHTYGSVRYRQCRAQESQRLKKMCQFHQQREEREQAADWCAAYESYQIVK